MKCGFRISVIVTGVFEETRIHFPYSLSADVLMANCCWEFGAVWNKNKDSVGNLQNAVCCLKRITGLPLRKGTIVTSSRLCLPNCVFYH